MIEKELTVRELIPTKQEGGGGDPDTFEYADVRYKYFIAQVDPETVAVSQVKILDTPDEEEKEYQEVATLHMHNDAFTVFENMIATFKERVL
jgi:hypothetical protein